MTYQGSGVNTSIDQLIVQLVNQHTATSNKLDAIIAALGAPPPTGQTTLTDVVTALTTLNTNISNLRTEMETQQSVLLNSVSSLNSQITSFRQENISWRTFQQGQLGNILAAISSVLDEQTRITNAIYATSCPCPGQTTLPPDLTTTPIPSAQEQEHCRRVQWMLNEFFAVWMPRIRDVATAINGTGTALALGALAATGVGAIPAALISGAAAAVNAAWFAGISGIVNEANTARRTQLRQALYNAPTATAAAAAWNSTIDSMADVNVAYRAAWKSLIWSSWFNDLYDQTKTPANSGGAWNTAGYSGTACVLAPTSCVTGGSTLWTNVGVHSADFRNTALSAYIDPAVGSGWNFLDARRGAISTFAGWRFRIVSSGGTIRVDCSTPFTSYYLVSTQSVILPSGTVTIQPYNHQSNTGAFTWELCPPGQF